MKRWQLVPKGTLARMQQTATEAWNRQDYEESIAILERASRLDPANAGLLLDLGRAYGMRYDCAAAEKYFERAAKVAPQRSEVLAAAGLQCRGFSRYEMAKHYFERAMAEPSASPDTFVKLAELYERFRFLKEATGLVETALQKDANCALAQLVQARLARLGGRLEEAEKVARSLVARAEPDSWSTRIRGWYELGAILDGQGRPDDAMTAFLEAKNMAKANAASYLAGQRRVHEKLKKVEADISAEQLGRWFENAQALSPARRLALLGGHPRSGTTLLEQVLDSHPELVSAEETTVFFYEVYLPIRRGLSEETPILAGLESASRELLLKLREQYFRCMDSMRDDPIGNRLLIDKNPSLTSLVPAMARVFPETKFLVALRDPRDVCLSCFMQPLPLNQVSATFLTLEDTVEEYVSVMGLWRTVAPRLPNPHLEVRYEDMVEDLESSARRVLEFLGVRWDERVLRFNEHARKKLVRSPTYADVTKPVFKGAVGRWRRYQKYLEPLLPKLDPFAKVFGYE
ncbi:MAG TPA: sulfotransferase [Candidatus Acidoferrales bacterium]|nr:sulfotransferase [Candidatus Acidoferrales bacterium]